MGELVDLAAYKKQKKEQEEIERLRKEQEELDQTLDDVKLLRDILTDIIKDLPDVETSIMYVPIEPKMDAFMSKDLDSWLAGIDLQIRMDENNGREDT
jgi:hypothetical protein